MNGLKVKYRCDWWGLIKDIRVKVIFLLLEKIHTELLLSNPTHPFA
jgi:hypothetical protein